MRNVIMLGLVSFFSDISSEMVYPIIPLYLSSAFGATPVLIGIIEGIAQSLTSLLKFFKSFLALIPDIHARSRWYYCSCFKPVNCRAEIDSGFDTIPHRSLERGGVLCYDVSNLKRMRLSYQD